MTARLASLADKMRRIALANARPRDVVQAAPWYTIKRDEVASDRTLVIIDGEIGWNVVASDFGAELRAIATPFIDLQINSPGGSVWDGYAIYHAIATHPAHVTAHIVGVAASAASFIAMAADEIVAYRPCEMMIHDAAGWLDVWGYVNPARIDQIITDITALRDSLALTSDEIAAIYARKAGGTAEAWRAAMTAETWYSADTALAAGLVDRINGDDAAEADASTEDSPAPGVTGASDHAPLTAVGIVRARHAARLAREGVS